MLRSQLYVSVSKLRESDCFEAVDAMVGRAKRNNERLGLTGALLFTGRRFAQYIEGPSESVERLMKVIAHDVRHSEMTVLFDRFCPARLFADWSLSYSGASLYVDRHVQALIERVPGRNTDADSAKLLKLILSTTGAINEGRGIARRRESAAG